MVGLIVGVSAGLAFIGFNVYEKLKYTRLNDSLKEQYKYISQVNSSKNAVWLNALMAGLAIGLGVVNLNDWTSIGISFALISSFVGNIIAARTHRTVLFFEKGFSLDGVYTRYKSINTITPIKKGRKFKLLLLNQNTVILDKEAHTVLESLRHKKG